MPNITPDWVQAGELGFAFIVVILCAGLIFFVVRSSEKREKLLLDALMQSNKELSSITAIIQQMKDDFIGRLDAIEDTLKIKPRKPKVP